MAYIRKIKGKDGDVYSIEVKVFNKGDGQYHSKSMRWKPEPGMTPKQAEKQAIIVGYEFEQKIANDIDAVNGLDKVDYTFREYSEKWLERIKRDFSLNYYDRSKRVLKNINKSIGGYKLKEISPSILQNYFDKLNESKRRVATVVGKPNCKKVIESYGYSFNEIRNKKGIQTTSLVYLYNGRTVGEKWSEKFADVLGIPYEEIFDKTVEYRPYKWATIQEYRKTIRAILSCAKKARLIDVNFATSDYIDSPKKPKERIKVMNDEEAKKIYATLLNYKDIRIKTSMLVFLLTGFRRGEVAGLEWQDIDFENETISIERTVNYTPGFGIYEKDPKTVLSKRTITVPKILIEQLKEYKNWQDEYKEQMGDAYAPGDKVFTNLDGKLFNPDLYNTWLDKVLMEAGIKHYTLHSIRHTNITLQIAAGVPLVTVSARAGHARTSTTTDIYAHALKSTDRMASEKIEEIFDPNKVFEERVKDETIDITESKHYNDSIGCITNEETVSEFRKAKYEMKRLGFETYDEYLDYLEYMEKVHNKKVPEM